MLMTMGVSEQDKDLGHLDHFRSLPTTFCDFYSILNQHLNLIMSYIQLIRLKLIIISVLFLRCSIAKKYLSLILCIRSAGIFMYQLLNLQT